MTLDCHRLLRLLIVPLLLLGGCSEAGDPTGALGTERPLASKGTGIPDLAALARFDQKPGITIAWAKKWIGPEGGRLEFQGFAIDVPAGAVASVTQFSIHLPVDPKASERVLATFGPHGSRFAVPVTIELPFAGTSITESPWVTIVWWSGSEWVDMGAALTADGLRLETSTDHFSDYGTTDERGGGTLVSGG
jgi:hypothetical protein